MQRGFRRIIMRLRELRRKKKISQVALAFKLDMSQNTISRYETGEREADYASLIKFATFFNVSIDYLLELTDEEKPYPRKENKK